MTAAGSVRVPGGLSRAVEALSSSRALATEPKALAAQPTRPRPVASEEAQGRLAPSSSASMLGTSASRERDDATSDALSELRRLFASECSLGTSAPSFGVSPPVRSGAANGLVHDSLWRAEAPRACRASLRALHERAGPRCLSSCAGDYSLLVASPDTGTALLAGAVEGEGNDMEGSTSTSTAWYPGAATTAAGGGYPGLAWMDDGAASAGRSMASSRASASPAPGSWYGAAAGRTACSPSPDPESNLLFSY